MRHTPQAQGVTDADLDLADDATALRRDFVRKLYYELGKFSGVATLNDHYFALALAVRDRQLERWIKSVRTFLEGGHRTVLYLSAEYLLGPQLGNNLLNLGIEGDTRKAMEALGLDLDTLVEHEAEPGLGNGGLGRLAACYLDSLATLDRPAIGYGLRYEFGIFAQQIRNGEQVEVVDRWLRHGNPWEIRRWDIEIPVGFGGRTEHFTDALGRDRARWVPEWKVRGVPYDTPVLGYGTENANFLRLWAAMPDEEFDLEAFQVGEYWKAVADKVASENISKVLYPNDQSEAGKRLRLQQEYFFVACSLKDAIRLLLQRRTIDEFPDKYAIQLNDTHPALAVAELMRLLMDEHGYDWDEAWAVTHRAISYTNHTLLPEALETWSVGLFGALLPRHLEIIFGINDRFLAEVRERFPGDPARVSRMSLIDESNGRRVRMAHLATVASHTVNGVAALHSRLLTETVLSDFAEMWPERFTNVTNGVTPRRFVALSNPRLTGLITEAIGDGWLRDLERLRELEPFAEDPGFRQRWREVKQANKADLARWLRRDHGLDVDPRSLFDVQCKRIHEYKRQQLALLHALTIWQRIRRGQVAGLEPRTLLIAGKAAPGYWMAKRIVRFATAVAEAIDRDPVARDLLRVVFVPDFNVKTAQRLYPAAELSEQISTAGMEASGTGNMKLALNGALTIGTLDGANVEIREAVGEEHFFLFGMDADEVAARRRARVDPREPLLADPELRSVIALVDDGDLAGGDRELFAPLVRNLVHQDPFFVLADFAAYAACHERVAERRRDVEGWTRSSILNTARTGRFSSDRSVLEYAERIWHVPPVTIER